MNQPSGRCPLPVRAEAPGETLAYYVMLPLTWARQFLHNGHGILRVLDITRARPMPAGMINKQHPWVTGVNPDTGKPIWHDNVLFQSPRPEGARYPADDVIITRVGRFLADLVARSAVVPEIPWGPRRRMPHGINYIHGTVHYNSGILIFNDFQEAIYYFSDRRFRNEVCRFARTERREILLIFRDRRYTARDYAYLMGFLRSVLPWFCNSNGPLKRVMWGNPSPFPVVNIIAGNWITDVYALKTEAGKQEVVRPPVRRGKYLQHDEYRGTRREARWPEKLLALFANHRVRLRGSRGGLFFVDRRKLLAAKLERMRKAGIPDEPVAAL
jgi:hypothetical protein